MGEAVAKIPLTKGFEAIVDIDCYEWITGLGKWTYHNAGYAYRWDRTVSPNKCILMHRVINDTPDDMVTDHINRDKLDNRRLNLRTVTSSANALNKPTLGIEKSTHWSGYVVRIIADRTRIYVGRFSDEEEAKHISQDIKLQLLEAIV